MPWTTMDEFNVVPKTQRMSLASFPGHKSNVIHQRMLLMRCNASGIELQLVKALKMVG